MKITIPRSRKKKFEYAFVAAVLVLALGRCVYRAVGGGSVEDAAGQDMSAAAVDSVRVRSLLNDSLLMGERRVPCFLDGTGSPVRNRIYSVPGFKKTFPDLNDVQLVTASRLGVEPVRDRSQAEQRKNELVYVGSSPYYVVEELRHSIPYLVPRAARLLDHIGRNFLDSLEMKQIPLHTLIVTSVLRTEDDIARLRKRNCNATEQSCHRYGTTFDISYNRYNTVEDPDGPSARAVRNDTLKWVLSEVLRDLREAGTCYVKYEVKQGCYHVTVR